MFENQHLQNTYGNGLIHEITKKPPRELFKKEYTKLQKYLEKKSDGIFIHTVYHDTVEYRDNLYKLIPESVSEGEKIRIERYDDQLIFYHAGTNELLCKHRLLLGKGNVVTLNVEVHDEPMIEEVLLDEYKDYEISSIFFKRLREQKPRYVYPQCRKIGSLKKHYAKEIIAEGMSYCVEVDICTAFELCSWLVYKMGVTIAKRVLPTGYIKNEKYNIIFKDIFNTIKNNDREHILHTCMRYNTLLKRDKLGGGLLNER